MCLRPPPRQRAAAEGADAHAVDFDVASGRRVEPSHQIEQGRLARARRPHEREEVALGNIEVDALEHVDALAAASEMLVNVTNFDE